MLLPSLYMFLNEVYAELKERNIPICAFSKKILGCPSRLSSLYSSGANISTSTLEKIAAGLDMKLIVCLGDKDEE